VGLKKSQKNVSAYRSHMEMREGLSFSDYFDDSVPYEVKPLPPVTPTMEEDDNKFVGHSDFPTQAKDLFKGLWETENLLNSKYDSFWLDKIGKFYSAGSSHFHWAQMYLRQNNVVHGEYIVSEKMFELGFIKVSLFRLYKKLNFEYDRKIGPPNYRQMAKLKNAAIELGYTLHDTITNKSIELTESLLLKNILNCPKTNKLILKEAARILSPNTHYFLDPQGEFHNVDIEGSHMNWTKKYMASKGLTYHSEGNPYAAAFKLGLIRIVTDENMMVIDHSKEVLPTELQLKILKDTAKKSGLILFDNTLNKTINLTESSNLLDNRRIKDLFIEGMMPDDIDTFKSHLVQLFAHLQKELKFKIVPKVKLLSNDKNAAKVLGKTAYYDPDTRTINLYVTDRHQKDILRSFSHETVHHWQHENEKFQTSRTGGKAGEDPQYAQHNPWLRQMEKQAYLLGNIIFRDWEDQKKAKDRKSGKKMVELHGKNNVSKDSHTPIMKKYYRPSHPYRKHTEGPYPNPEGDDGECISEKTYLLGKEYPRKKMDYSG